MKTKTYKSGYQPNSPKVFIFTLVIFITFSFKFLAHAQTPEKVTTSSQEKRRLISLKPNITDILVELNLTHHLVGVTSYCKLPHGFEKIPKVADYMHPYVEEVLLQKPDLVLASKENSHKKGILFLKERGLTVLLYSFSRLDDVYTSIQQIADDLNVGLKGKKIVERMKSEISQSNQTKPKKKLAMIVGLRPLVLVGGNNYLNDVMTQLGFVNVAGLSKIRYPTWSKETLINANPDLIIDLSQSHEKKNAFRQSKIFFEDIPTLKNKKIYYLDVDDLSASPQLVKGAKKLKELNP